MASVASILPVTLPEKCVSLDPSKKRSASDTVESAETYTQGKTDVTFSPCGSAEDSRGSSTPEEESLNVSVMAPSPLDAPSRSPWASMQEALESAMDPFFLAGQSELKDERIAEELLRVMDTNLTAHVPALAELQFLRPFFAGYTRSERLDSVLRAARASRKLVLRDDLPVPPSAGWMLSVDETEAASLRLGPRSHADRNSCCTLVLERRRTAAACEATLRSITLDALQATIPAHKVLKTELVGSNPCARCVVFVSAIAADRAHAVWRSEPPHSDVRVTRDVKSRALQRAGSDFSKRSAATEKPARTLLPMPRTALRCPRIVGDLSPRHGSREGAATEAAERIAIPAPRTGAMLLKPPPAIDVWLNERGPLLKTTETCRTPRPDAPAAPISPTPAVTTSKSNFSVDAAPFLPKSVLNAQLAATTGAVTDLASPSLCWWHGSEGSTYPSPLPCGMALSCAPTMDTSEALAHQMLLDSSAGWMLAALDPCAGLPWEMRHTAADAWDKQQLHTPSTTGIERSSTLRKETPTTSTEHAPLAPRAGVLSAPCAIDGTPTSKAPCASNILNDNPKQYSLSATVPMESTSSSCYDVSGTVGVSPGGEQLSPSSVSRSRRLRHDPYGPAGFVLCREGSSSGSVSSPYITAFGTGLPTTAFSARLKFSGSFAGKLTTAKSYCFEDPQIKLSSRLRERRLKQQADAAGASSCEHESVSSSCSIIHSAPSGANDGEAEELLNATAPRYSYSVYTASAEGSTEAVSGAGPSPPEAGVVAAPKSYAEVTRMHSKRTSPAPMPVTLMPTVVGKGGARAAEATAAAALARNINAAHLTQKKV